MPPPWTIDEKTVMFERMQILMYKLAVIIPAFVTFGLYFFLLSFFITVK